MFGKKHTSYSPGLEEDPDEWNGPEPGAAKKTGQAEKIDLSEELVDHIRQHFFQVVNPSIAASLSRDELIGKVTTAVSEIVTQEKIPLNWREQSVIARDLLNDMVGLGPIEELLEDQEITDILVNGFNTVFVDRGGRLELTDLKFRDDEHLLSVAKRIALTAGRRVDESSPMVDARLSDGSRVNIIIPPLSIHGTIVSIRKFPLDRIHMDDLVEKAALSRQMAVFLEIATAARLNILISGGTGAGKTTLLNALSGYAGLEERIVTIEDAAEIDLQRPHVISLETRPKNLDGEGEISPRDLLRNALRMRPDRIIVGEVRGSEVHEMLQAMNTGHDGSLSTIHANSARDALLRIEDLLLSYHNNLNVMAIRRQVASAIDLVVHLDRDISGHRYVQSITEVVGLEAETLVTQELFGFRPDETRDPDVFEGSFLYSKIRPFCEEKIKRYQLSERLQACLRMS